MFKGGFRVILYLFWMALLISAIQLARFAIQDPQQRDILTNRQLLQDLQLLQQQIRRFSAFAVLKPQVNSQIEQAIAALAQRYPTQLSRQQLSIEVAKLMTLLTDPAASISPWPRESHLPLILRQMDHRWLALNEQQQAFDSERPFVTHIDGIPMQRWQLAAQQLLADGAERPQRLARMMAQTVLLRQQIGLSASDSVRVTLTNDELTPLSVTMPLATSPTAPTLAMSRWRLLAPNIQLLRNDDLDSFESNRQLRLDLQKALAADTLVLDLRHADGVSSSLLQLLAINHENPSSQPAGYGRYKRQPQLRNDFLAPFGYQALSRFNLFPSVKVRLMQASNSELSDWFARPPLVSSTQAEAISSINQSPQQLLLLIGPQCRHECEWLVHAAANWPRTLLLGSKTLGDFGRTHQFRLPASGLNVQFSASLAYDSYGNLLSGIGTAPDIEINTDGTVDWPSLLKALRHYRNNEISHPHTTPTETR
ncbi:hypothetical protein HR45_01460 [Shewanella mangrovi]|uniref:Tail specific protease domain-containing protein n=1 Tax=Shewanella mangrovi TaxID=1515746 RepID=A0A094LV30_9GAMM|nr:S41 family peptidase [Shewanella mangrovi]KFZ39093.1 hypothetical protein HR45_01460 [Shewanella mangrovi]